MCREPSDRLQPPPSGARSAIPALAVLAYYVEPLRVAEARVLAWFSSHEFTTPTSYRYTLAGHLARAITFFAEPVPLLIIVALGCAYAVWRRRPLDALAAVTVVAGANLTTQVLKHVLAHDRYQSFLAHPPNPDTFPSGHVTGAATMIVALIWIAARREGAPSPGPAPPTSSSSASRCWCSNGISRATSSAPSRSPAPGPSRPSRGIASCPSDIA